jgi:hypothetical protein
MRAIVETVIFVLLLVLVMIFTIKLSDCYQSDRIRIGNMLIAGCP